MPHEPPAVIDAPPASLGLETYAQAAAYLAQAQASPHEALAALDLSGDRLARAAAAWQRAIDEELALGGHTLLTRFAERFAEARARLAPTAPRPPPDPPLAPCPPPDSRPLRTPHRSPWVPDVPITDTTLRLDAGPCDPAPEHDNAPPFLLTRVKRRGVRAWLGRLFGWRS